MGTLEGHSLVEFQQPISGGGDFGGAETSLFNNRLFYASI